MKKLTAIYITLLIVQLVVAVAAAPHSCEWGNSVYFYTGVFCLVVAFMLPLLQKQWKMSKRIGFALLLMLASVALWIVQFTLLGFRVLCKLF